MPEEVLLYPFMQGLAHDLCKDILLCRYLNVSIVGGDAAPQTLIERRFFRSLHHGNDAVVIGPVGNGFAHFDLLRPAMPEEAQDQHRKAVFRQALFFRQTAPAFLFDTFFQEPINRDRVNLQFLGQLFQKGFRRDGDPGADGGLIVFFFIVI